MEIEAVMDVDAEMEAEAEAERKSDGDGEYEGEKRTSMPGSEVDSDAEVARRQKMTKETAGDLLRGGEVKSEEAAKIEPDEGERMRGYDKYLEWKRRKEEDYERNLDPEELTDPYAFEARMFRKTWDYVYFKRCGSYDKNTMIPCKRFTYDPPPHGSTDPDTVQVYYLKVEDISGGLCWLLEVYGLVALRDSLDHNRNIIFERERDICQMLTDKNPYLALTGPVRAVVIYGLVIFEAFLYVKGATRSDDRELSLIATSLGSFPYYGSRVIQRSYTSRLSTLELMIGHISYSVEATIEVRVTSGPWPDGFRCRFAAWAGIGQSIVLLETKDDHVPLTGDNKIKLARRVVSVESRGELQVLASIRNGYTVYTERKGFKPQKMGTSSKELCVGGCMLEITVYWSSFSILPVSLVQSANGENFVPYLFILK